MIDSQHSGSDAEASSAPGPGASAVIAAIWDEMRRRWSAGERVAAEVWLERDAVRQLGADAAIDVIYAEFAIRDQLGDDPSPSEFFQRFSQYEAALSRQFAFHAALAVDSAQEADATTQVAATNPQARVSPPTAHPLPCPGSFGKFVLVAPLGSGGQAFVYRAVHPDLGQELVLKVGRHGTPASDERILTEARLLARLSHPHLARVCDAGMENGLSYLAMEYVRGRTLADCASSAQLAPSKSLALMAKVARAVAAVHAEGILHLDIKPKNIVVDESFEPKLIDFGLSQWQTTWQAAAPGKLGISGTVQFMAPEQARGEIAKLSERTDVFALGGVLYFLLTGEAPSAGKSMSESLNVARAGGWNRQLLEQKHLSSGIRKLCEAAMHPEPSERPTALQFAQAADALARPVPLRRVLSLTAAAVLLLGSAVALGVANSAFPPKDKPLAHGTTPVTPPVVDVASKLEITVWDDDRYLLLADVVPIRTGGMLRMQAEIPAGMHAGLFLATSTGELKQLAVIPSEDAGRTFLYPESNQQAVPLTGAPGTEFLFLCGRRDGAVSLDDVRSAWTEASGAVASQWPALSKLTVFRVDRTGIEMEQQGRDVGAPQGQPNPDEAVRSRLDAFRRTMSDRCDMLSGVAFSHRK